MLTCHFRHGGRNQVCKHCNSIANFLNSQKCLKTKSIPIKSLICEGVHILACSYFLSICRTVTHWNSNLLCINGSRATFVKGPAG